MSEERFELSQYDELALKHNAAYAAFQVIHEAKNPKPEMPAIERESRLIPVILIIMILASVYVSGHRTIDTFGGGDVGIAAFAMIEGAIVAMAFFRTRRNFDEKRIEKVLTLAGYGLGLAFAGAVSANIKDVLHDAGIYIAPLVDTLLLLFVAVSAPTLAFISGDMLALETMAERVKERKAKREHDALCKQWRDEMNIAWSHQKRGWGATIRVEKPQPQSLESGVQLSNGQNGQKRTRESKALNAVIMHLESYPDDLELPVRVLAEKLGVSKSTVDNARQLLKDED